MLRFLFGLRLVFCFIGVWKSKGNFLVIGVWKSKGKCLVIGVWKSKGILFAIGVWKSKGNCLVIGVCWFCFDGFSCVFVCFFSGSWGNLRVQM